MFRRHPLLSLVTLGYLGFVGWATLGPQPINASNSHWLWVALNFFSAHHSTQWITYNRVQFIANIGMFVPVGVFLLLLFGRRLWFVAVLGGAALTCAIEAAQLFIPGRVSDVWDLVANTLGAVIGVLFALVITASKARRLRVRRA
jgi:glycopeptide antibiotics resistance protein